VSSSNRRAPLLRRVSNVSARSPLGNERRWVAWIAAGVAAAGRFGAEGFFAGGGGAHIGQSRPEGEAIEAVKIAQRHRADYSGRALRRIG